MRFLCLTGVVLFAAGCNEMANTERTRTTHTAARPAELGTAETGVPPAATPAHAPDSTGVNVRDRDSQAKTPIDQNENQRDVNITADIRKQVVDTKMSTYAHNVKIMTQDGKVTLRGPVASQEEKDQIEQIAVKVAGAGNVENLLEISTGK